MIRSIFALALAGFREAIRNRVTVVVAMFAVVLILLTSVVLNVTVFSLDRVVTDFGLGVMSLLLLGLSVFMSVGMLQREMDRKTVFLIVSRSISRNTFLLGRFLGLTATLTLLLAMMSLIFASQLLIFKVEPTLAMFAAIAGIWMHVVVVSAMGLFFASFTGAVTASTCVVALYLIGQWTGDLYTLAIKAPPALQAAMHALYWVLPNLARMDFKPNAAGLLPVERADFFLAVGSALGWTSLFVCGAMFLFQRRDFK